MKSKIDNGQCLQDLIEYILDGGLVQDALNFPSACVFIRILETCLSSFPPEQHLHSLINVGEESTIVGTT